MGISDEEYGEALERQRAFQVELMKLELQKMKEEQKMSISGATGLGNLIGSMGGIGQQALNSNGISPYQQAQQQYAGNGGSGLSATNTTGTGTVHISHGGTTTTFNSSGLYNQATIGGGGGLRPITEVDLKHDAMQAPLSALIDMWTMRWQGEWVNEAEFDEDDFWRLALIRLMGANKLEKHNLANQYRSVYRIIE